MKSPRSFEGVQDAASTASSEERYARRSDIQLIRETSAGDVGAFREIVHRYRGKMMSMVSDIVLNREDAEEVVQDTFIRVYRHLSDFENRTHLLLWMYRISLNLSIDLMRRRSSERSHAHMTLDEMSQEDELRELSEDPDVLELLPDRKKVRRVFEAMPEPFATILKLRYLDQASRPEIAEMLEVPLGTVHSRLFRAEQLFKQKYAEVFPDADFKEVPNVQ